MSKHQINSAVTTQTTTFASDATNNALPAPKPSILAKFSLDFEYDKTLQEVRRDTRARTQKTA